MIRNAGGVVSDDAPSLARHLALAARHAEAFVIAQTDCGMLTFTNEQLRQTLADQAGADASGINFLPFPNPDERVRESVRRISESPLLPDSFTAGGFVYDVRSGQLCEVAVPSGAGSRV